MTKENPKRRIEDPVCIANFTHAHQAEVAAASLEGEGIATLVFADEVSNLIPVTAGTSGGAQLKVDREEANRALEILEDNNLGERGEDGQLEKHPSKADQSSVPTYACPECGDKSHRLAFFKSYVVLALSGSPSVGWFWEPATGVMTFICMALFGFWLAVIGLWPYTCSECRYYGLKSSFQLSE